MRITPFLALAALLLVSNPNGIVAAGGYLAFGVFALIFACSSTARRDSEAAPQGPVSPRAGAATLAGPTPRVVVDREPAALPWNEAARETACPRQGAGTTTRSRS